MKIDGSQIRLETVTGNEILDESILGEDIKDGTVAFIDLTPELSSRILENTKNSMVNSTEIRALKNQELDSNLSVFVDSFDDGSSIDGQSSNFEIDVIGGFASLVQGGSLSTKVSTQAEFDLGTYSNVESFISVGGDGSIRKERSTIGGTYTYPNFPTGTTVTIDGVAVPLSTVPGTFIEGSESSKVPVLFTDPTANSKILEITLPTAIDLSTYKYLLFNYLKRTESLLTYQLTIEDSSTNTYTFPIRAFESSPAFQDIKEDLILSSGVTLSSIKKIRIVISEDIDDQTIFDLTPQSGSLHREISDTDVVKQSFNLTEDTKAQVVKIRTRWENNQPNDDLYIAVANAFDTTLGVGILKASDANNAFNEYFVELDNSFTLKAGIPYSILFRSPGTDRLNAWDLARTSNGAFPDYICSFNGSAKVYSIVTALYKPYINETIFLDNLHALEETTYINTANEYISDAINLGLTPNALSNVFWTEGGDGIGIINIRVRTATSEAGLSTTTWSSAYDNGDSLAAVTPLQWLQFQVIFSGGNATSSKAVRDVTITYSTLPGTGNAIIISAAEFTESAPEKFMMLWDVADNAGTSNFYVSRDGKATWQSVNDSQEGEYIDFTSGSGTQVQMKAILTGDAKLYSWSLACDKEFI
jgi:hypothetical protein